jgi:hypothetical protein
MLKTLFLVIVAFFGLAGVASAQFGLQDRAGNRLPSLFPTQPLPPLPGTTRIWYGYGFGYGLPALNYQAYPYYYNYYNYNYFYRVPVYPQYYRAPTYNYGYRAPVYGYGYHNYGGGYGYHNYGGGYHHGRR